MGRTCGLEGDRRQENGDIIIMYKKIKWGSKMSSTTSTTTSATSTTTGSTSTGSTTTGSTTTGSTTTGSTTTGSTTTGTTSATSTTTTGTTTATSVTAAPSDNFSELMGVITRGSDFALRAPVNIQEAIQFRRLYTVGNYILARVPESIESLNQTLTSDSDGGLNLVRKGELIDIHIKTIESILERTSDEFNNEESVLRELRRQLDLGTETVQEQEVNIEFKAIFKEFIELSEDELLSVDPDEEKIKNNPLWDASKTEELYKLLKKLKRVIIKLTENMSDFGTLGTQSLVQKWSDILADALNLLDKVGDNHIASDDLDDLHVWSVLADLTNVQKSDIEGYIVHAREGGQMLRDVIDIYQKIEVEGHLEDEAHTYLRKLFHEKDFVFPDKTVSEVLRNKASLVNENWIPIWS